MNWLRSLILAAAGVCVMLSASPNPASAQSGSRSIQSFNRLKPNWSKLVGSRFRLEGRYALYSTNLVKFVKCDLPFRPTKRLSRPTGRSRTIEVSGLIANDGGKLYFAMNQLKQLPSDLETFKLRKTRFRTPLPQDWYDLADWAAERARFYEDQELASQAESAYISGIRLERQELKGDIPAGLVALVSRVEEFQLPQSFRLELLHEAYYLSWLKLTKTKADTAKLIDRIAKDLPGSTIARKQNTRPKLRESYLKTPVSFYRGSDERQRELLHRLLFSRVSIEHILKTANPDGSNGFLTAQLIDQRLPEMHELAESYRDRELEYQLKNIGNAPKQDMRKLANQFLLRQNQKKANETVLKWMNIREQSLRKEGPEGLILLAQNYLEILQDDQTAVKLLVEADKKLSGTKEIVDRLDRLGFVKVNGRWESKQELANRPENEIDRSMRQGIVVPGMTGSQVRKALGRPDSIARIATEGKVAEVWIYDRLVIQLIRRIQRSDAIVVGISQVQSRGKRSL